MHPALSKLASIEQAATRGPWDAPPTGFDVLAPHEAASCKTIIVNGEIRSEDLSMIAAECSDGESFYTIYSPEDRACIAAARNALPALIAALVEIEQVATFLARPDEPGECETCEQAEHNGGRRDAAKDLLAIIAKHLEPLK